jgi:hypothetical protein
MMFGHPEAVVTASLAKLRKFARIVERDARIAAFSNGSEVEYRERYHEKRYGEHAARRK